MKAVHFGAGNIGRGFVGDLLHDSGYEIVFLDVDTKMVNEINKSHSYKLRFAAEPSVHWLLWELSSELK